MGLCEDDIASRDGEKQLYVLHVHMYVSMYSGSEIFQTRRELQYLKYCIKIHVFLYHKLVDYV